MGDHPGAGLGARLHRDDIDYVSLSDTQAVSPIVISYRAGDRSPLLAHCLALVQETAAQQA